MAEHKKFQFKGGAKKVESVQESPVAPPPAPTPSLETLLSQLLDQKLAAMQNQAVPAVAAAPVVSAPTSPVPVQDKDFEMIEDAVANKPEAKKEEKKAKLPKLSKEKPELKARKLVIEDTEQREVFEQAVIDFNIARSEKNDATAREKEGRGIVVATMGDKLIYEGEKVDVNVKEIANISVNAEKVFEALVDPKSDIEELRAGIQQLFDLARLGVIEIGKGNFERWVKGHGYDPEPFMVRHEPERRIYITPK